MANFLGTTQGGREIPKNQDSATNTDELEKLCDTTPNDLLSDNNTTATEYKLKEIQDLQQSIKHGQDLYSKLPTLITPSCYAPEYFVSTPKDTGVLKLSHGDSAVVPTLGDLWDKRIKELEAERKRESVKEPTGNDNTAEKQSVQLLMKQFQENTWQGYVSIHKYSDEVPPTPEGFQCSQKRPLPIDPYGDDITVEIKQKGKTINTYREQLRKVRAGWNFPTATLVQVVPDDIRKTALNVAVYQGAECICHFDLAEVLPVQESTSNDAWLQN